MNEEVLEIVSGEDPQQYNRLFITGSIDENSILTYKVGNKLKSVTEGKSRFRPIHCSELTERLKERGYNIWGTKFIRRVTNNGSPQPLDNSAELWIYTGKTDTQVPKIDTNTNNFSFKCCENELPGSEEVETLMEEYKQIFGESMNNRNELQFYSASMSVINLIENEVEVDLINYNSDTYTNILNLSELISYNAKPGISGTINMTVEYSKESNIYVRDVSFQAFNYTQTENDLPILKIDNHVSYIEDDVQVEYINGTIRVNPINSKINECIIIRCSVIYGNL